MSDAQIADLLRDVGISVSPRRLRRWRLEGLLEQPETVVCRRGGAGRSSLRYDDRQLRRVLPAARELTALGPGLSTSESTVLLFVRGRAVSAVRLVLAVRELAPQSLRSAARAVTVDDLVDARACLYGLPDLFAERGGGAAQPAPVDDVNAVGATRALLTARRDGHRHGLAHVLWDAWLSGTGEVGDGPAERAMAPLW